MTINKKLDFVFVDVPVGTAELKWHEFLAIRHEVPAFHQLEYVPAVAGSFLVSNEVRIAGLVPAQQRSIAGSVPTVKLLRDFQDWQRSSSRQGANALAPNNAELATLERRS